MPAKGLGKDVPAYSFRMQVSPYDCLGCGVCLTVCPANSNEKSADALVMTPFEEMKPEQTNFDEVAMNDAYLKKDVISSKNVKSMQFAKPYFQFSAACAGCAIPIPSVTSTRAITTRRWHCWAVRTTSRSIFSGRRKNSVET